MDFKKVLKAVDAFFGDTEDPNEPKYDPVHVGAMILLVLFGITILFWLLWCILVFGGGLQAKVLPFLQMVFTGKTAADFGYVGYPYEMGVFEGWPTNIIASAIGIYLIVMIWKILNSNTEKEKKNEDQLQPEAE